MGTYVGLIRIRNNFVNFKPVFELDHGALVLLTQQDRKALLPESLYGDICLYFNDERYVKSASYFYNGEYCVHSFDIYDLDDYLNSYGERNKTGYKLDITQAYDSRELKPISAFGWYYVLPLSAVRGNYKTNPTLKIDCEIDSFVYSGLQVVLPLDEHRLLGPFTVEYDRIEDQLFISTNLQANSYLLKGFTFHESINDSGKLFPGLSADGEQGHDHFFVNTNESCEQTFIDVISPEKLLTEFKKTISDDCFVDGKIDLSDIGDLLAKYKDSCLSSPSISEEVRNNRFDSLKTILEDEKILNESFNGIADVICDLLEKYQGKPTYGKLLERLIAEPEFRKRFDRFDTFTNAIKEEQRAVEELTQQRKSLESDIEEQKIAISNKKSEYADSLLDEYDAEIQQRKADLEQLAAEIEASKETLSDFETCADLEKKLKEVSQAVKYKETRERELDEKLKVISNKIDSVFEDSTEKAMHFAFDGMLSSRMMRQAAEWENDQSTISYGEKIASLKEVNLSDKKDRELVDYLYEEIHSIRPSYSKNTILNFFICMTQNFLTVFSGEPGTGKTSICKILGATLGLSSIDKALPCYEDGYNPNRFVSVAVERGWTTKRDFVGYFNPLTKTFDRSNRLIFDSLNVLDREAKGELSNLPFVIMLDEANLSPMEYYWADFMNVCDQLDGNSSINLGNDYIFRIPENLRFVATINNDHTTESLSPRLIDRAWIIRLPRVAPSNKVDSEYTGRDFEKVSWSSLCDVFNERISDVTLMSGDVKEKFDSLSNQFRQAHITISPRAEAAIERYWSIAQKWFESDNSIVDSQTIALDYAISQRVLPHIDGSGEIFGKKLKTIADYCEEQNLRMSAEIINAILQKGEENMQYYQFFAI